MTIEAPTLIEDEALTLPDDGEYLRWTPVVAGAFAAAAFSFILVTFGITIGLGALGTHVDTLRSTRRTQQPVELVAQQWFGRGGVCDRRR